MLCHYSEIDKIKDDTMEENEVGEVNDYLVITT